MIRDSRAHRSETHCEVVITSAPPCHDTVRGSERYVWSDHGHGADRTVQVSRAGADDQVTRRLIAAFGLTADDGICLLSSFDATASSDERSE